LSSHLKAISINEARREIGLCNSKLAGSLGRLLIKTQRPAPQNVFLASYQYGQLLMGERASPNGDLIGGFLPPCGDRRDECKDCASLLKKIGNERPLFIVLNKTIEEFLEDQSGGERLRVAPTRLLKAGQVVGLTESLNALLDPTYPRRAFKAPMRKASAGVRSIYATAPIGNKELKSLLKAKWLRSAKEIRDPDLWSSEWDDWRFLKTTAQVAQAQTKLSWDVQVIVIPLSWLRSYVYSRGQVNPAARDFLLHLFEMAWKESRGLRSESIRQMTISETARGVQENTNADLITQRLLLILRGDAPGFRPAMLSNEHFPLTAIWGLLLGDEKLRKRFFSDKFPAIIEPFHLDRRVGVQPGTFFYYPLTSFEQFGYPGKPEDEIETMEKLDQLLKQIKRENPELLGSVRWQFFASPEPLKGKAGEEIPRVTTVEFLSAHTSEVIQHDFADHLKGAGKFQSITSSTLLSKRPRKGFLRRFIRVALD
jgi:hypothetical protein